MFSADSDRHIVHIPGQADGSTRKYDYGEQSAL